MIGDTELKPPFVISAANKVQSIKVFRDRRGSDIVMFDRAPTPHMMGRAPSDYERHRHTQDALFCHFHACLHLH